MAHKFGSAQTRQKIVDGPSKFDFMASLFSGNPYGVRFTLERPKEHTLQIFEFFIESASSIEGDRNRWLFEGWYKRPGGDELGTRFSALYDVRLRSGWLEHPNAKAGPKGINLDELQQETEKLLALLKDRQPGTMGWIKFMNERMTNLYELTSVALGK